MRTRCALRGTRESPVENASSGPDLVTGNEKTLYTRCDQVDRCMIINSTLGSFHFGEVQKRTNPKVFLALSRDVGTVRVHRDSAALFRCKSGTGPRPGITSASPSIVVVIAALHYIMCSMPRDNDGARERCGSSTASCEQSAHRPHK